MASPCRDRDIKINAADHPVRVTFNGQIIARTTRALSLDEPGHSPVLYVPQDDVDPAVLKPSDHHTTCPFKGEASYNDLDAAGTRSANAVWYYPDPCPLVERIRGHVAFWGDDIEISGG